MIGRNRRFHFFWLITLVLAGLAFLTQRLFAGSPQSVELNYSRTWFHVIADPIAAISSAVPFSLAEAFLVLGAVVVLVLFIFWIIRLIRRTERVARIGRLFRGLVILVSLAYVVFILLHGMNYDRLPVAESFSLPVVERSGTELKDTTLWLAEQANKLRATRMEDQKGVFKLTVGVPDTLRTAYEGYLGAASQYPLLAGPSIRPKAVLLSHEMSYTWTAGIYFPFFVESNINVDIPEYEIPATTLHEIAHTRGFAREDEAGFLAFLAGLAHPNADFAYSVLLDAMVRGLNQLASVDEKGYKEVADLLSDAVWRDLGAGQAYWKQFEGPVQEVSNQVNNSYLKSNLQKDGVFSYGRMMDLVLAWYEAESEAMSLDKSIASLNLESPPLSGS